MASWYDKNIIPQSGFSGEVEGSPALTLFVGIAIGAVGMYAYQNREMMKRHLLTPGIHRPVPSRERVERDTWIDVGPPEAWRSTTPPHDTAVEHERGPYGNLTGRWRHIGE
jgi:hypothetical protein